VRSHPAALAAGISIEDDLYGGVVGSGILRKYILREIGRDEANLFLRSKAINLCAVYHWYFERSGNINPITDGLKPIKQHWEQLFAQLASRLNDCRSQLIDLDNLARNNKALLESEFEVIRKNAVAVQKQTSRVKSGAKDFLQRPIDFKDTTLFGKSQKLEQQFRAGMTELVNTLATGKLKFEQSLITDLLHSLYLPFCDLWRGDREFAHLLKAGRVPHCDKIVSKLSDLPKRIAEAKSAKLT
jgi:hypothetical protein